MTEAASLLRILRLPGIGPVGLRKLCAKLVQMGIPPERLLELSDVDLAGNLMLNAAQIAALRQPPTNADEDLQHCAEQGIQVLLPSDPRYPWRVLTLLGRLSPPLLFAKGNLDLLDYPALGLSGSRKANETSLKAVAELSRVVGSTGWVVVSGGARGADEAAHLNCLQDGPGTIIVLPTGVLKPNLRQDLKKHLEEGKTLLLSEFPPEVGWTVGCAMQRNRFLAALSWVMVLVEPGLTGGTGGTGNLARRYGIPLYVLNSGDFESAGAQEFLQTGAKLLTLEHQTSAELSSEFHHAHQEAEARRQSLQTPSLFSS